MERWRDTPEASTLNKLMQLDIADSEEKDKRSILFNDAIHKLSQQHRELRHDYLINKSQQEPLSAEEKAELKQLLVRP